MSRLFLWPSVALIAALLTSCQGEAGSVPNAGNPPATAAGAVDSQIPREEALRRFRAGLDSVDVLTGGADSRDALVRGFVVALEARDTVALRTMVMSRQEFAWIYYPTTPQGLPPYDLSPSLLWFLLDNRGQIGLGRALAQRGGRELRLVGYACDPKPSIEGENRVWGPCVIRRKQAPGDTIEERLFGPILERRGRFKFVNYANRLD